MFVLSFQQRGGEVKISLGVRLKVMHWRCRKSDVEIKHLIKLSDAAECNNTAAGSCLSTCGQIDR